MREMRLAILFSGNGSNLENIYKKMQNLVLNSSLGASNSVLGMQFRTCGNFRTSTDSSLVESPKISTNTKATPQSLPLRFCDSQNLGENQAKIAESSADSANLAKIKLNFVLAISSKESAFGITRCANLGLKCEVVDCKKNKADFFQKIMQILRDEQIDLVVLAGFMRILPPTFTAKFHAINIHPSILPLFKGANAIKESFESDMKIAGVSVHFVSDELDSGALIAQDIIHKIEGESLENFEARIHELEYKLYPKAIIKAVKIVGNSQNIGKNNPSLRDSAKQNRGKPPIEKNAKLQSGLPREQSSLAMTRNNDFAESTLDSANQNILSLRADSQNLRGNPPIEKSVELQNGLPRSHLLARNDEILDSSLRKCSAQNDKIEAENDKNSVRVAESRLDSANSKHKTPNL